VNSKSSHPKKEKGKMALTSFDSKICPDCKNEMEDKKTGDFTILLQTAPTADQDSQ